MQVHVAGGRGFLGAAVVRALTARGLPVSTSGRVPPEPEAMHAAQSLVWCGGVRSSERDALWAAHVAAPRDLLARASHVRSVVYVSSGEVYGAQPVPFEEDAATLGDSPYARAKLMGEDVLREVCARRSVVLTIVRPGVIYGPGQRPGMLVPSAIDHLLRGAPLEVTAGAQGRDFVFVSDVAAAIAHLASEPRAGVFNLGTGREVTVREVISQLAALVGPHASALVRWGHLPYRDREQMRYVLDCQRARRELGWSAEVSLAAGLAQCVAAMRQVPEVHEVHEVPEGDELRELPQVCVTSAWGATRDEAARDP
jgi:nucleoside-diphosphate-sugar epimerase